jgi:hypothetical protein
LRRPPLAGALACRRSTRHSLQRTNAAAQLQRRASWDGLRRSGRYPPPAAPVQRVASQTGHRAGRASLPEPPGSGVYGSARGHRSRSAFGNTFAKGVLHRAGFGAPIQTPRRCQKIRLAHAVVPENRAVMRRAPSRSARYRATHSNNDSLRADAPRMRRKPARACIAFYAISREGLNAPSILSRSRPKPREIKDIQVDFGRRFSVHNSRPAPLVQETCVRCCGTGHIRERGERLICRACKGTGRITVKEDRAS